MLYRYIFFGKIAVSYQTYIIEVGPVRIRGNQTFSEVLSKGKKTFSEC